MPDKKLTDKEIIKAWDILAKLDFFGGQRAGRELWNEKPVDVQNEDIKNFSKDIAFLKNLINRLQAENERLKEPTSASFIHILAEKAVEALHEENEKLKIEIMRLEHNERVLSENSIIAQYPHHWLLDKGWFLSKEPDGFGKWKAQVSNEAIKRFEERLKAKAEVFPELRLIVIKEKDWDNLLKELVGEDNG